MVLRHATTRQAWQQIQEQGLLVDRADRQAKIRGVWLHSPAQSAWAVVHTMRKHGVQLEDVVVVEVHVPRSQLRRFKRGLWYTQVDVSVSALGACVSGASFGASAAE